MYFIQAEVTIKIFGISGPFVRNVAKLVNAPSSQEAKNKFEAHCRQHFSNMAFESMSFNYVTFADTI